LKKEKWPILWIVILCGCVIVVAISLLLPTFTEVISGFTTEIIGTFVGFLLAISFTEIAKVADQNNRGRKLKRQLLGEINTIVFMLREKVTAVPVDYWEMSLSTGEYGLLDEDTQMEFWAFYNSIKTLKAETEDYLDMDRRGAPQEKKDEVFEGMVKIRNLTIEKGLELLKNNRISIYDRSGLHPTIPS